MNNTNNCTSIISRFDNIPALLISIIIINTVFFIVDNLTRFRWKIKDRPFCSKKRNNWGIWIKYYIAHNIVYILLYILVYSIVPLVIK